MKKVSKTMLVATHADGFARVSRASQALARELQRTPKYAGRPLFLIYHEGLMALAKQEGLC